MPFDGATVLKRLMAHMERPAPSLRTQRPEVPASLEAIYQKMMAKSPADRPASMTELISLLEVVQGRREGESPDCGEAPKSKPELKVFNEAPLKRPPRRRPIETHRSSPAPRKTRGSRSITT